MRSDNFILAILALIARVTIFVASALVQLTIFLIKQMFYFFCGCFKVLFASTNTKVTAIVLICASLLDACIVYQFTNQYKYALIHLLIIVSPVFYLASVGRRPGVVEKEVYANDK